MSDEERELVAYSKTRPALLELLGYLELLPEQVVLPVDRWRMMQAIREFRALETRKER